MKFKLKESITENKVYDFDLAADNFYKKLFGKGPNEGKLKAKNIKTGEEIYLSIDCGSLLTTEEAEQIRKYDNYPVIGSRILSAAECGWWLRSPYNRNSASAINVNGGTTYSFVDNPYPGVRPALYIKNYEPLKLEIGDSYEINDIEFEYVLPGILLVKGIIGRYPFRTKEHCIEMSDCKGDEWRDEDKPFSDYNTSDIKTFINDWMIGSNF